MTLWHGVYGRTKSFSSYILLIVAGPRELMVLRPCSLMVLVLSCDIVLRHGLKAAGELVWSKMNVLESKVHEYVTELYIIFLLNFYCHRRR